MIPVVWECDWLVCVLRWTGDRVYFCQLPNCQDRIQSHWDCVKSFFLVLHDGANDVASVSPETTESLHVMDIKSICWRFIFVWSERWFAASPALSRGGFEQVLLCFLPCINFAFIVQNRFCQELHPVHWQPGDTIILCPPFGKGPPFSHE